MNRQSHRDKFTAKDGTELLITLEGEDADPRNWQTIGNCRVPESLQITERFWDGGSKTEDPNQDFVYVHYGFGMIGGAHRCLMLEMESSTGTREIQASDLRRIRIEYVLESALLHICQWQEPWPTSPSSRRRDVSAVVKRRRAVSDDVLAKVATVYENNLDDAPTQAVADHFGIQLRTASLRVKKAREAGYITSTAKAGRKPQ